jgi:hypothetical protein
MLLVTDTPRFADGKHAFVDAATDAAAWVVVKLGRGNSRVASVQPRIRRNDVHSRRRCLSFGVGIARLRRGQIPDSLVRSLAGPAIAKICEL